MRTKKIMSLLLSTAFLNLTTNLTNCFGMMPLNDNYSTISDDSVTEIALQDDSVTEIALQDDSVTEIALQEGYVHCPICGKPRPSKMTTDNKYSAACPGCGSHAVKGRRKCYYRRRAIANSDIACGHCGCRRFKRNGKDPRTSEQRYACANCLTSQKNILKDRPERQNWKEGFCECKSIDGYVRSIPIVSLTGKGSRGYANRISNIENVLQNPRGFIYYCYNCKKEEHITLKGQRLKEALARYLMHIEELNRET